MEARTLSDPAKAMPKTQAERTELSDSRMLDACINLIVEQGAAKTTLKAVGELAGYSRGLAGARFKSKTGLFCFVIKRIAVYWRAEMEKQTGNKIGYSALCAAIDAHYQFCKDKPLPVQAFYSLWFEAIESENELREVVIGIHQRRLESVIEWINRAIEAGELVDTIDAEAVARHFLTSMFGIVYQWLIDPGKDREIRNMHDQLKQSLRLLLPPENKQI